MLASSLQPFSMAASAQPCTAAKEFPKHLHVFRYPCSVSNSSAAARRCDDRCDKAQEGRLSWIN